MTKKQNKSDLQNFIDNIKAESDSIEDLLVEDVTENSQEIGWHHFASPSSNALLDDDEEGIHSYFVHRDQLKDVVACPGVILPSLQNSCYVPIEEILGPLLEDDEEILLNNQNHTTQEQSGPVLLKKKTPPKHTENKKGGIYG